MTASDSDSYSYNANSNLTSKTVYSVTTNYTGDAPDRLTAISSPTAMFHKYRRISQRDRYISASCPAIWWTRSASPASPQQSMILQPPAARAVTRSTPTPGTLSAS